MKAGLVGFVFGGGFGFWFGHRQGCKDMADYLRREYPQIGYWMKLKGKL